MTETGLSGKIKVPGIKEPLPKPAVFAGLAVTGFFIYRYFSGKSKTAATPATTTDQYPPDGTTGNPQDLYSTDPATGQTYGDEQAGQTGYGAYGGGASGDAYPWDGSYGNPSDPYSMDTATGQTYGNEGNTGGGSGSGGGGGGGGGGHSGPPFGTNDEWARYVRSHIPKSIGAVGLYLNGRQLDSSQAQIIYEAIAVAGAVPVDGSGGYPPKLRMAPDGHKGGKTFAGNPVKGLKQDSATKDTITVTWDASHDATGYQVKLVTAHQSTHAPVTTNLTRFVFRSLKPGTGYQVHVLAKPAEKGAKDATVSVHTGGGGSGKVKVPDVKGFSHQVAAGHIQAAGLKARLGAGTRVAWNVGSESPAAGTEVARGSTVVLEPPKVRL